MYILNELNLRFAFHFVCTLCVCVGGGGCVCVLCAYARWLIHLPISAFTLLPRPFLYCWGFLTFFFYNPVYITTVSQILGFSLAGRNSRIVSVVECKLWSWSTRMKFSAITCKMCDLTSSIEWRYQ